MAAQVIAEADVALLGTVTAAEEAFELFQEFGPSVRYTVAVERASVATAAEVHVLALDDSGGSCGVSFDVGDRWMLAASAEGGALRTHLCAGSIPLDGEHEAIADRIVASLPFVPLSGSEDDAIGSVQRLLVVAPAVALLLAAVTFTFLAFRRRARSP